MQLLSVTELKSWVDENKNDFVVVDVRESDELDICKIDFAQHIPLGQIPAKIESLPADKKVIFSCKSGRRSANAAQYVESLSGRNDLYSLDGGILEWIEKVDPTQSTY